MESPKSMPLGEPRRPLRVVTAVERSACVGLALVLLLSAGFALYTAHAASGSLERMHVATSLSAAYQEARYAVAMEESLERKYRLEPTPAILADHQNAERALAAAIEAISVSGDAADRTQDAQLLRYHAKYVAATRAMFAAVNARKWKLVEHLDTDVTDPVFDYVEENVFRRAAQQQTKTEAFITSIRVLQSRLGKISALL